MKHMDAVNVLRATKQFVKLVVLRRPTGVSDNPTMCDGLSMQTGSVLGSCASYISSNRKLTCKLG